MSTVDRKQWTEVVRERAVGALPPEKLLPDTQPTYMSSWIYVFGVLSLVSLVLIILSGVILTLQGPDWWHTSSIGHFFNSTHMWAVELFFFFVVIHLWGKYWMAAWRGGRRRVWITGAITFVVAVPAALTGYVSQQNFDSQWISTQAKDAMNSVGIGSFFNLMDFGQMYSYHVVLFPIAVVALVGAHVLLVRKHGIVPPFNLAEAVAASAAGAGTEGPPAGTETPTNGAGSAKNGAPAASPAPAARPGPRFAPHPDTAHEPIPDVPTEPVP
jgi:quinol-cytochrome oxidoreductase complex cytochrome b subunit